jgi:hypothetical protein
MKFLECAALEIALGWQAPLCCSGSKFSKLTFSVSDVAIGKHVTIVVYGEMRFYGPANTTVANLTARKLLGDRIS